MVIEVLLLCGCVSTKTNNEEIRPLGTDQNATGPKVKDENASVAFQDYSNDDHSYIGQINSQKIPVLNKFTDSLTQIESNAVENKNGLQALLLENVLDSNSVGSSSPVAAKIVENYLNSKNKEPNGHCLDVSRGRFERAYKEVYGHLPYKDLPDSMGSKLYTPKQVFHLLYVSASDENEGWRSLPEAYRGKGNAGAIAYAGMGDLVDKSGIWSGKLRPGALVQVWRFKEDYEKVARGTNVKKLDPYGHSFIFIGYVRNEKNEITGLIIADQGFQSYRPLEPNDYQVWWAVNLNV
jgi:hypothetical protein